MKPTNFKEMGMVKILKGEGYTNSFYKDMLISIKPTADGLIFSLKGGIEIIITDDRMPLHTKNIIENSMINIFNTKAEVIYDLNNYNKPVQLVLNS